MGIQNINWQKVPGNSDRELATIDGREFMCVRHRESWGWSWFDTWEWIKDACGRDMRVRVFEGRPIHVEVVDSPYTERVRFVRCNGSGEAPRTKPCTICKQHLEVAA